MPSPNDLPEDTTLEQTHAEVRKFAAEMAGAPLDTLALPLLAPVARLLLSAEPYVTGKRGTAKPLDGDTELLATNPGLESPDALAAALRCGMYVLEHVALVFDSGVLVGWLELEGPDLPLPVMTRRAKAWYRRAEPPVPIAALAAAAMSDGSVPSLVQRGARPGRTLAHDLYRYAQTRGVTTWGAAHAVAADYWSDPGHRTEQLLVAWRAALVSLELSDLVLPETGRMMADADLEGEAPSADPEKPDEIVPDPVVVAALAARAELEARCRELERVSQEQQVELEQSRESRDRARSRLNAQKESLDPLKLELARQSKLIRSLTNQFAELRATADTGTIDPIDPPPEEGWPDDLLSGIAIVLFSGQERTGVRNSMGDALRAVGAEVDVRDGNGKREIPERFAPDTLVICDVRFMSHTFSGLIKDRARRSDVRCVELRHGEGGIVRAVAAVAGRPARDGTS